MLPADFPFASFRRTSVSELHAVPSSKKKEAASSVMSQFSRNLMGYVIVGAPSWKTLHTPRGFLALSLVQLATLLLKGQRRFERYLTASFDWSSIRYPKTSASGS
jgi:hypothetical protein